MDNQLKDLIAHAREQGATKDQFKGAVMRLMAPKSRYRLRGQAGQKSFNRDVGSVFAAIDDLWDDVVH